MVVYVLQHLYAVGRNKAQSECVLVIILVIAEANQTPNFTGGATHHPVSKWLLIVSIHQSCSLVYMCCRSYELLRCVCLIVFLRLL